MSIQRITEIFVNLTYSPSIDVVKSVILFAKLTHTFLSIEVPSNFEEEIGNGQSQFNIDNFLSSWRVFAIPMDIGKTTGVALKRTP
jgi:hypothetical protein